jgi:hypothetical protein
MKTRTDYAVFMVISQIIYVIIYEGYFSTWKQISVIKAISNAKEMSEFTNYGSSP